MTPRGVEITRPDKSQWPALGITKKAYIDYLGAVADRKLPWLRDRPLSLIRAPDGVDGPRYFQDQLAHLRGRRRAPEGLPSEGPFASDQFPVPAKDRRGPDEEGGPKGQRQEQTGGQIPPDPARRLVMHGLQRT